MNSQPDVSASPVVFVTGAAGGLGLALVKAFAANGYRVAAAFHKNPLPSDSGAALSLPLDVSDMAAADAAVEQVISQLGRLDVVVNNAGVTVDAVVPKLSIEDWEHCVSICLKGAFHCTRAALPFMARIRRGHIINIGSFSGRTGKPGQAAYAAAKAGLIGFTQSVAREYGSRAIQANVALPGAMLTGMTAGLGEQDMAAFAASNVLGRMTDPNEVAPFICHIARLKCASGQVFQLDSRIAAWI